MIKKLAGTNYWSFSENIKYISYGDDFRDNKEGDYSEYFSKYQTENPIAVQNNA